MLENTSFDPNTQPPAPSAPVVTPPVVQPAITPQVIVGGTSTPQPVGGGGPNMFSKLVQMLANGGHALWITAGIAGLLVIGGVSFFAVSHHGNQPQKETAAQTKTDGSKGDKQSSDAATGEDKPADTDTANQPTDSSTKDTAKNKKTSGTTGGGTSGGNTGGSGGTGGDTGGGGGTPAGPIALKIMPLGDSLTQGGVNGNLPSGQKESTTLNGYRLELKNLLVAAGYTIDYVGSWQLGDSNLSDQDLNGFSGACIMIDPCGGGTLYSQTAGWLNTYNPDLVLMNGGANDYGAGGVTDAQNLAAMQSWIQLVWTTKPNAKIIVSGVTWHDTYDAMVHDYVDDLQAQGKPIRWVPYGWDISRIDLTHPDAAGYITWANELAPMVQELYSL